VETVGFHWLLLKHWKLPLILLRPRSRVVTALRVVQVNTILAIQLVELKFSLL